MVRASTIFPVEMEFESNFKSIFSISRRQTSVIFITGSLILGTSVYTLLALIRVLRSLLAPQNALPMGLPNPKNLCYLNAVLQAMSTNSSLVRFLRRSAHSHPNKMLYCLVCVLKGLRCSNRYIVSNNLQDVILESHRMLLMELTKSMRWSPDDQQDAPELFSYFMDIACSRSPGRTASKATEGLSSISQLVGPHLKHAVPRCFHRCRTDGKNGLYAFRPPIQTDVFQRHLLTSQVICTNCGYRSSPNLQAEACITLCLDPSWSTTINRTSCLRRSPGSNCSFSPSLYDYLAKEFGTTEKLNDFLCPECQQKERKSCPPIAHYCQQERWIAHLPSCLVIHIQRGEWMGRYMPTDLKPTWPVGAKKRSDYLSFPYHLDMTDFMLSSKHSRRSRHISPTDRITQTDSHDSYFRRRHYYVLRSVLVHQGESVHAGHYIAYRTWRKADPVSQKKRYHPTRILRSMFTSVSNFFRALPSDASVTSSPWVFASDEQVFRVSPTEVQSSSAYLLFYERELPHFRPFFAGSLYRRSPGFDDRCLTDFIQSNSVNFHHPSREAGWNRLEMNKDVYNGIFDHSVPDIVATYPKGCEEDDTDDDGDMDDEGEESDIPSDFTEEEFTGSRAEVIRSLALSAAQL